MVVGVVRRLDPVLVVVHGRRPLIGFTAEEAAEFIEALAGGPAGHGARRAYLLHGGLVPLPERGRAVPVVVQHFSDRRHVIGQHTCVAGKRGRQFGDLAHRGRMVVATGLQGLAGRRTE